MNIIALIFLLPGNIGVAEPHSQDDFSVNVTLEKDVYLLAEPIVVSTELRNTSGREQKILYDQNAFSATIRFDIRDSDGKIARHLYHGPSITDENEGDFVKILRADERISLSVTITDKYMMLSSGSYTIQAVFQCLGKANTWNGLVTSDMKSLTIKPVENEEDIRIVRALYKGHNYYYSTNACKKILEISNTSAYAKYARFYMAENSRAWMEGGAGTYVKNAFDEAIDNYTKVVNDKFTFSDEAQLGIAKCYVIKEDNDTAAKEAQKVIDNFPNSNSVDEARELLKQITEQQAKKNIDTLKKK